jgi:hypothetical protein
MKPFGLRAVRRPEEALTVEGLGRLTQPRRAGAYLIHTVEDGLEAVQFAPAGLDAEGGQGAQARVVYDEAFEAFLELGERLKALELAAGPRVRAVVRAPQGAFWLQDATGLTLEAWLATHAAPSEATIRSFARRLAAALDSLHARGLVHGDLSPATIVIAEGGVRLALPAIDRRGLFRVLRSQAGLVQPGYAPPEAHDGARRQPIGPAADLYGASAVLRRLLTGQAPEAATAVVRLAGDVTDAALADSPMRRGVEAGMAMTAAQRPASAAAWLAGLGLAPDAEEAAWFEGAEAPPPRAAEPPLTLLSEPTIDAPPEADFVIAPPPPASLSPLGDEAALGPIGGARVDRSAPSRGSGLISTLLIAAAICTAAVAGGVAVSLRPEPKPIRSAAAAPALAPLPMAPVGCQWSPSGGAGLRLLCADEPGLVALPDRFDTQTATLASRGEVASMERLGSFYRARAARLTSSKRVTYGDEAYAWLARAADSNPTGRSEDDRARDDAALALGEMFGRGEGGRAIDPAAAEARLRQAAAGSRADAVLALAQRLWAEAQQDPEGGAARLAEARRLFSRVARLPEDSPLRVTARQALAEIDAGRAAAAAAAQAARDAAAREAAQAAEAARAEEAAKASRAAPKPSPAKASKPVIPPRAMAKARAMIGEAKSKLAAAKDVAVKAATAATKPPPPPKPAPKPAAKRVEAPRPAQPAPVRSWTTRASVRIDDPAADFTLEVQEAGHAACEAEGGYAASVREGEVICPNGVNYCQVRVAAFCRGL